MIENIMNSIANITTTQVALASVALTLILFILGKNKENKLKIYEVRKEKYEFLLTVKNHETKSRNKITRM